MGLFNFFNKKETDKKEVSNEMDGQRWVENYSPIGSYDNSFPSYGGYPVITVPFDGEKTAGELGILVKSVPNYEALRIRGYEADLRLGIVKMCTRAYYDWIIGSGLKLQYEPNKTVLEYEGLSLDSEKWVSIQKKIENYFKLFCDSNYSTYKEDMNIHKQALECYKTAFVGGDCLVVCRLDKDYNITVQLIDGQHVKTPLERLTDNTIDIRNGVEYDKKGRVIAFHVATLKDGLEHFEKIEVYGKNTNLKMAWMHYGNKTRIDSSRGIPEITAILETVNKLDRYTEASVSKAEKAAQIVFTVEHQEFSTGEDILQEKLNQRRNKSVSNPEDIATQSQRVADNISQTTNSTAFNMPNGASMKSFGTTIETDYSEFIKTNIELVAASIGMPPEIAMKSFNSNYSASRAAINIWAHTVRIERKDFSDSFYAPIFRLWLEVQVLKGKFDFPEYLNAIMKSNRYFTDAFTQCRFTGPNMPHIDPLKEVNAIRKMLGDEFTPLITLEKATEDLGNGEFNEVLSSFSEEKKMVTKHLGENYGKEENGANTEL